MPSCYLQVYEKLTSVHKDYDYWREYTSFYESYWGGPTSPYGIWFGNEYETFENNLADHLQIDKKDLKYLKNLKYLIVDCLRYNFHPTHFNLEDVFDLIHKIKPKKTILTNLSNEIDYNEIKKKLPKNVIPAYDGLTVLI